MGDIVPVESAAPTTTEAVEGEIIQLTPFQRAMADAVDRLMQGASNRGEAGRVYEVLDAMVTGIGDKETRLPPHEMQRLRQALDDKFAGLDEER